MKAYNILIVEDAVFNAEFIRKVVLSLGHKVVDVTDDAKSTLEVVSKQAVDLVLMDINIVGPTDGISLAKKLNEKHTLPIIYMTAFGDSATISETKGTNLYGYVVKPFDAQDIEAALSVAIQRIESEKDLITNNTSDCKTILDNGYYYNTNSKILFHEEEEIVFTKNEKLLFDVLFTHYNEVVSCDLLRNKIWYNKSVSDSTIRDTISRLRKKVPELNIVNSISLGYSLKGRRNEKNVRLEK
jgi:DNA-binding response OmpR family regulator